MMRARTDVLIGMDVIAFGDFVISNKAGKTKMSYRVPSAGDWDFVQEINKRNAGNRATRRAQGKTQRRGRRP